MASASGTGSSSSSSLSSSSRRPEIIAELTELLEEDIKNSFLYKMTFRTYTQIQRIKNISFEDLQNDEYYIEFKDDINLDNTIENLEKIKENMINYIYSEFNSNLEELGIFQENNEDKIYYSAYSNNMTINEFKNKNAIWISERIDQAILHPINNPILDPVMFEFKLKNFYYLRSSTKDNKIIFNKIFKEINQKFVTYVNNKLNIRHNNVENIFSNNTNNNKYILYIIDVINKFLPPDFFNLSGYMNLYDQYEVALLHFDSLVKTSSIIKYQYTKVVFNDREIKLPLSSPRDIREIDRSIQIMYSDVNGIGPEGVTRFDAFRMVCIGNLKIYYNSIIEDEKIIGDEKIFDCSTLTKSDIFKNKYIKYKKKYLQLKIQLL